MKYKLPGWQYILLLVVLLISIIYALPNIYGEDPSIQIAIKPELIENSNKNADDRQKLAGDQIDSTLAQITDLLTKNNLKLRSIDHKKQQAAHELIIHFFTVEAQLMAKDLIEDLLGEQYSVALNLTPGVPKWLSYLGATPMKLGLDLRGGVRLLMEVDLNSLLTTAKVNGADLNTRLNTELKNSVMERTMVTIRNRVNELGVAEALVQRQGSNNIIVELPGMQDIVRAKNILGKTATLHFAMVDDSNLPGPTNKVVPDRLGHKILVKKKVILTGDAIIWANSGFDSRDHQAIVGLRLINNHTIDEFKKATIKNLGRNMAIIYREHKLIEKQGVKTPAIEETVISVARINSALGESFQISGLNLAESRDLALLLRAGAMPAAVSIVEERIVGPSLGQENIKMGIFSVCLGCSLVLIAMLIYYNLFGLIANIALLMNLVLLIAAMSLIGATLTLPGIAGIVLTLGMAVDANVLIFERIREELRTGASNLNSIYKGFQYALATIIDSNLTTLIVGLILFFVGTGPVKGFAVVLSLGILTSLFTAITGTRAIVGLLYEGKYHLKKIWIGI